MSELYKGKIIAVDFDGTCVTHEFPQVGRDIGAVPVLQRLVAEGAKLILWTMRSDTQPSVHTKTGEPLEHPTPLTDAVDWFRDHGIPLYGIQCNPTQRTWTSSPKAYAHIYIDDAALGCPLLQGEEGERPYVDWKKVNRMMFPVKLTRKGTKP